MKTKERLTAEDVRPEFEDFARTEPVRGFALNLCRSAETDEYIVTKVEIAWRAFLKAKGLWR